MKIHKVDEETRQFWCPGCIDIHTLSKEFKVVEEVEGRPTIRQATIMNKKDGEVCHIRMEWGKLTYLPDTTHQLKGDTVDMVDIDEIL